MRARAAVVIYEGNMGAYMWPRLCKHSKAGGSESPHECQTQSGRYMLHYIISVMNEKKGALEVNLTEADIITYL